MLHRLLTTLVAGLTLLAGVALADARLTIVHVNDIDQMSEVRGAGGTARLAAVVKGERARAEHVLVTHGGDMISPSLLSGFDKGAHMVELMNAIGLDGRPRVFGLRALLEEWATYRLETVRRELPCLTHRRLRA